MMVHLKSRDENNLHLGRSCRYDLTVPVRGHREVPSMTSLSKESKNRKLSLSQTGRTLEKELVSTNCDT